ncbi:hypothetical protein L1887_04449 [Cichorium endivia]|nr:hypothetical protein L1887_04449 [Cichorium endivia]
MVSGRGPCNKFPDKSRNRSTESFSSGNPIAVNELDLRFKISRFDNRPRENGIVPFNRFKFKSSFRNPIRFSKDVGIGPVNPLPDRSSSLKVVKLPRASGMVPDNLFILTYNLFKAVNLCSRVGNTPPNVLLYRISVSRENRAHSDTLVDGPLSPSFK